LYLIKYLDIFIKFSFLFVY